MRVDSWNEEEDEPVAPAPPVAAQPETTSTIETQAPAEANVSASEQKLTFMEAVGRAPLWLWLLAIFTIGPICLMVTIILGLLIFYK